MAVSDDAESSGRLSESTKFQTAILAVLADEARYGLATKRELEDYYGEEIGHSRIYTNLTQLVDHGLVEKTALDNRKNEYALTEAGRERLTRDLEWYTDRVIDTALVDAATTDSGDSSDDTESTSSGDGYDAGESDAWDVEFPVPSGVTPAVVHAAVNNCDTLRGVLEELDWPEDDPHARSRVRALVYREGRYSDLKRPEGQP